MANCSDVLADALGFESADSMAAATLQHLDIGAQRAGIGLDEIKPILAALAFALDRLQSTEHGWEK